MTSRSPRTGQHPNADHPPAVSASVEGAAQREAHTPGPWVAKRTGPLFQEYEIVADGDEIALIYADDGYDEPTAFPAEANATLIAAAPDMLALLKEISADALCRDGAPPGIGHIERVEALIAKATGRA